MKVKNKNALVFGMSLSGEWAVKLLNKLGANIYVYDDNPDQIKGKTLTNCFLVRTIDNYLALKLDFVIVSPSISLDNPSLRFLQSYNIKIFSEVEFASQFDSNILAVTGTNGKTTTVELITAILNKQYSAIACGNIGYPLSRAVLENKRAIKVVEVSSFMLEHADNFHPHIATVLNVEPDHLIRHKTFDEYLNLKKSIFKNLTANDYAVVNLDKNIHPTTNCMKLTYSLTHPADICLTDGYLTINRRKILPVSGLNLKGKHNLQNILCAVCFAVIMRVPDNLIAQAVGEFKPNNFRMQEVGTQNKIRFINDSKSTNIASTLACAETIKGSLILLLGGSDKGLDYTELFRKLSKRVRLVVAFGEIAQNLVDANQNLFLTSHYKFEITQCKNLSTAFDYAATHAKEGEAVVLSPASASYDEFKNYIERGKAFNKKVKDYEQNTEI